MSSEPYGPAWPLICDTCHGPAAWPDKDGLYYEDENLKCVSCGAPGEIVVVETPEEDVNVAYWRPEGEW